MESTISLNGQPVTRELVGTWLEQKKITLWADWCITDPRRKEKAIDWFMEEMAALGASMGNGSSTTTTKGKRSKKNGTVRN